VASGLMCRANRPNTAAPTNAANVKKALANSEPSTHGSCETSIMRDARYTAIRAIGRRGQIGRNGRMPWEGANGAEYTPDVQRSSS
jgi:hypothetical protein